MTATTRAQAATIDGLQQALMGNALAGELDGFEPAEQADKGELGRAALRAATPLRLSELATNEEFALVLTRRNANGVHEAVQLVSDPATLEKLIRRCA